MKPLKLNRDDKSGQFTFGAHGQTPPTPSAKSPAHHPAADTSTNQVSDAWNAFTETAAASRISKVPEGEVVECSLCGVARPRGTAHRCPAPNLIQLTEATQKVLTACRAAGGTPVIVGGSVRDAILSKNRNTQFTPKDIDIEVYRVNTFAPLQKQLRPLGRIDITGVSFGVLKATVDGEEFDIALPRTDSKTGDGHQAFETTTNATLDEIDAFARRDFTLNAMGWDPETQEIIDPWGGTTDLTNGILRHTSDAFVEDPLRVLRGVQFAARFNLTLAPETARLTQMMAPGFAHIAKERVWAEFAKLTTSGVHISRGLQVLHESGWESHFPELAAIRDVPQDPTWHPEGPVHVHIGLAGDRAAEIAIRDGLTSDERHLSVLAAILHDLGKAGEGTQQEETESGSKITSHGHADHGVVEAGRFLSRLNAPNRVAEHILPLIREHMTAASFGDIPPTPAAVRRLMRRLSSSPNGPTLANWSRLLEADAGGRGSGNKEPVGHLWVAVANQTGGSTSRSSLLRGNHLTDLGLTPGPQFSVLIKEAVQAQDDGVFHDEKGAIAWVTQRLAND